MPTIQHTLVLCPKPEARLAVLRQFLKGVKTATVVFFDEKRLSLLPKIAAALKQDDLRVDVLNEADDLETVGVFEAFVDGKRAVDDGPGGAGPRRPADGSRGKFRRPADRTIGRGARRARAARRRADDLREEADDLENKLGVGVDEVAASDKQACGCWGAGGCCVIRCSAYDDGPEGVRSPVDCQWTRPRVGGSRVLHLPY